MQAFKIVGFLFATLTKIPSATAHSEVERAESPRSSAFVHKTGSGNLVFAVAAAKDDGRFFFHLEAPAEYSWMAIGTGDKMDGSIMMVAYRSSNKTGVTFSPRSVDGQVEPSHDEGIDCQIFAGNSNSNGVVKFNDRDVLSLNGVCTNMTKPGAGEDKQKIDLTSTHQDFIFALGPTGKHIQTDSKIADIRRHTLYGQFYMDLFKATNSRAEEIDQSHLGRVGDWENSNAQLVGDVTNDYDWAAPAHAVLMCGTFMILFPIGIIFLRLVEKVKWHAWMQGIGMGLAIVGFGAGIYLGREYNHSKDMNSAHQIIGLIVMFFTLAQFGLGMFHHRIYKRSQQGTVFGRIHLYLGPLVLILGAVNGFSGFSLASEGNANIWYGVVVGVISITLVAALFWARRRRSRSNTQRCTSQTELNEYAS